MKKTKDILNSDLSDLRKMEKLFLAYFESPESQRDEFKAVIEKAADELAFDTIPASWLTYPDGSWEFRFANKHKSTTNWRFIEGGNFPKVAGKEDVVVEPYIVHKYTVTQDEYQKVMGINPSHYGDRPQAPVESVSFYDACCFCNMQAMLMGESPSYFFQLDVEGDEIEPLLSYDGEQTIHAIIENSEAGFGPKLPTEVQWEYMCRAGTTTDTYNGDLPSDEKKAHKVLDKIAWYNNNTQHDRRPQVVGQKMPNHYDIYDTIGNVWEWTSTPYED